MSTFVPPTVSTTRYPWGVRGDINAFFGLMLDNIGDMILMAALLVRVFGMPVDFVLTRMIPGTAVGVMVGDLIYSAMAFRLARKTGRTDVTAMPQVAVDPGGLVGLGGDVGRRPHQPLPDPPSLDESPLPAGVAFEEGAASAPGCDAPAAWAPKKRAADAPAPPTAESS